MEAARQALDAAQTKANDAAVENVTQGAGAGPSRDTAHDLGQAVFDAREELTEQTRILNELNYASAAAGGPTAPVASLPENADVQAFPKEPPVLERATGAFGEGMKDASKTVWDATMPDVGNMYHVATDWEGATPAERTQAIADAAGMVPLPGAKILREGVEHGLDALGGVARHVDDAPTPHVDVDPPPTPHSHVDDVPSGGHAHGPVHTDAGDVPTTPQTLGMARRMGSMTPAHFWPRARTPADTSLNAMSARPSTTFPLAWIPPDCRWCRRLTPPTKRPRPSVAHSNTINRRLTNGYRMELSGSLNLTHHSAVGRYFAVVLMKR